MLDVQKQTKQKSPCSHGAYIPQRKPWYTGGSSVLLFYKVARTFLSDTWSGYLGQKHCKAGGTDVWRTCGRDVLHMMGKSKVVRVAEEKRRAEWGRRWIQGKTPASEQSLMVQSKDLGFHSECDEGYESKSDVFLSVQSKETTQRYFQNWRNNQVKKSSDPIDYQAKLTRKAIL